uniref:Ribosome-recycling factor, chloroplastic n=1 Tax=Rhizophora mucronata TaxID=61149 RepID=A0A2P2L061_RHIMU
MATSFSSTSALRSVFQPNPKPPKAFVSFSGAQCVRVCSNSGSVRLRLWSSAANYSSFWSCVTKLSGSPTVVKQLPQRRGVVRFATIEEIEAEKSSIEKNAKARMDKSIETVRMNFNSVRTGRANPAMLDKVEVEYYGSPVSLKSIAQISTPDAGSLLVQPYDKSSLKAIEKAIVSSDLGLTPNNDGELIRLSIPQLTSERRKELSKVVAKQAEEGKVLLVFRYWD